MLLVFFEEMKKHEYVDIELKKGMNGLHELVGITSLLDLRTGA